eukprot:13024224-Ditylum_brightwellii.AAC.1
MRKIIRNPRKKTTQPSRRRTSLVLLTALINSSTILKARNYDAPVDKMAKIAPPTHKEGGQIKPHPTYVMNNQVV